MLGLPEVYLVTYLQPDPASAALGVEFCLHRYHPGAWLSPVIPSGD